MSIKHQEKSSGVFVPYAHGVFKDLFGTEPAEPEIDSLFNVTFAPAKAVPTAYEQGHNASYNELPKEAATTWWERFKENYVKVTNGLDELGYDIEGNKRTGEALFNVAKAAAGAAMVAVDKTKEIASLGIDILEGAINLAALGVKCKQLNSVQGPLGLSSLQNEQLRKEVEQEIRNIHNTFGYVFSNPVAIAKTVGQEMWDDMAKRYTQGSEAWEKGDYFEIGLLLQLIGKYTKSMKTKIFLLLFFQVERILI